MNWQSRRFSLVTTKKTTTIHVYGDIYLIKNSHGWVAYDTPSQCAWGHNYSFNALYDARRFVEAVAYVSYYSVLKRHIVSSHTAIP